MHGFWQREQELSNLGRSIQLWPVSLLQQREIRGGKRLVQGPRDSRVQIGIARPEDDPHRSVKRLQIGLALRVGLERGVQIARQADDCGEGRRRGGKLRPDELPEGTRRIRRLSQSIRRPWIELRTLPSKESFGRFRVMGDGIGQRSVGGVGKEGEPLRKAQGRGGSIVRVQQDERGNLPRMVERPVDRHGSG